ncbi:MAG: magnesium transporter [Firmicutes bacterium]|nr:magnesium transporter [Bacillota bacterium]
MTIRDLDYLKQEISKFIEEKDIKSLKNLLCELDDVETLFVMNEVTNREKVIVFRLLSKDSAHLTFEQLDTSIQKELLESFTDEYAKEIVEELAPDDRVQLFEELPPSVVSRLIKSLSVEERKITNMLMGYEPETAGRIMTPEFIALNRDMTADEALQKVRVQAKDKETIYTLYVTGDKKKLEGVVSLKMLLTAEPEEKIEDIMIDSVIMAWTDTDREEAAKKLKDYDLLAIPVVDREGCIVGIITIDDALDILEQEATEDIYDHAGLADITGKETNRSEVLVRGSVWAIWKVRLPFLVITLVAGLAAGLIIDGFEETLEYIGVAVAIFIPVIMDMGGNVGTQSTTVFVRGVVLGHIEMKTFWRHLLKEVLVGASIGLIVGVITGIIGGVWQGMPMLGLAVGLSLFVTMTLAAFLGFLVPYILIKLKADQAAGAAPIITSIKDIVGLIIYFVLVTAFMGLM